MSFHSHQSRKVEQDEKKRGSSKLLFWFKLCVSLAFVVVLCKSVPLAEVVRLFSSVNIYYLLLSLLISYVMILESCLKWSILLRQKKIKVPIHSLVRLYVLGYFFNNFLPSMVGGDSARGVILGRRINRLTDVFLSIFMERFTGFLALIFLAAATVLINHPLVRIGNLRTIVFMLLAGSLLIIVFVFSRTLFSLTMSLLPRRLEGIRKKADMLHVSLLEFSKHKMSFAVVLGLSLVFHVLTGVNLYYGCLVLNYHVDLLSMIVAAPFIVLLSLLPITINGIGLWESSFVLFFSLLGIPSSLALSVALFLRLKSLLVSTLGGIFYLQEGKARRAEMTRKQPVESNE